MTIHSQHEEPEGAKWPPLLYDNCPRCAQYADNPFEYMTPAQLAASSRLRNLDPDKLTVNERAALQVILDVELHWHRLETAHARYGRPW